MQTYIKYNNLSTGVNGVPYCLWFIKWFTCFIFHKFCKGNRCFEYGTQKKFCAEKKN